MLLKDVLQKTTQFFREKGFDSPRLDTELLLAKALSWDRLKLYLNYEYPLSEKELGEARDLVRRRASGEPVAYILGTKDFYNHSFIVSPAVLIPRPETEAITHAVIDWHRSLTSSPAHTLESAEDAASEAVRSNDNDIFNDDASNGAVPSEITEATDAIDAAVAAEPQLFRIVDLGTGSGCIGLSILAEIPEARLLAVDVSRDALEIARQNAERLGVSERVQFLESDAAALDAATVAGLLGDSADAVVANPPYIAENDPEVQPQVKAFEPSSALFADDDGLAQIRAWAQSSARVARPGALIMFEMGYKQGPQARAIFEATKAFETIEIVRDLGGLDRFIRCFKNERS